MNRKFAVGLVSFLGISAAMPALAQEENSCYIELAVSSPPVELSQSVAFNVSTDYGFSQSRTLKGGSAPQTIEQLPCTDTPYTISASLYSAHANQLTAVGQCLLKAGQISLSAPYNSVSVVFPNDFVCN